MGYLERYYSEKRTGKCIKFTDTGSVNLNVKKIAGYEGKSTLLFEIADTGIGPEDMSVLIIDDDEIACEHARLVLEKKQELLQR